MARKKVVTWSLLNAADCKVLSIWTDPEANGREYFEIRHPLWSDTTKNFFRSRAGRIVYVNQQEGYAYMVDGQLTLPE